MTDDSPLIPTAQRFYAALDANNTREWWHENKSTYDNALKAPAQQLLDGVSGPLAQMTECAIKTKLFRPHRDVRFSKDKTPYTTHLHMMWEMQTEAPQNPVFFFGIGIDYVTVGAGIMGFDKPVLMNWRQMVDLDTARIMGVIDTIRTKGFTLREPALKRVPPPYDKAHPAAELLRMKGLVASAALEQADPLHDQIVAAFADLAPLNALLVSIAEA